MNYYFQLFAENLNKTLQVIHNATLIDNYFRRFLGLCIVHTKINRDLLVMFQAQRYMVFLFFISLLFSNIFLLIYISAKFL